MFSDTLSASAAGYLGGRVQLLFNAGGSQGEPGLSPGLSTMRGYMGRTQLRLGLSRFAALSADYFYYHYAFGPDFPLPAGMSRAFDRQRVRVGVDLWVPLLR